jgi:hypothetical protein
MLDDMRQWLLHSSQSLPMLPLAGSIRDGPVVSKFRIGKYVRPSAEGGRETIDGFFVFFVAIEENTETYLNIGIHVGSVGGHLCCADKEVGYTMMYFGSRMV